MKIFNYIIAFFQLSIAVFASYLYYAHTQNIFVFGYQVIGIYEVMACSMIVWGLSILAGWINMYSILRRHKNEVAKLELDKSIMIPDVIQINTLFSFANEKPIYFETMPEDRGDVMRSYINSVPRLYNMYRECMESCSNKEIAVLSLSEKNNALQNENSRLIEANAKLIQECSQKKSLKSSKSSRKKTGK